MAPTVRTVAFAATLVALAWSVALTGLAALGNTWVLDRVSGGLFAGGEMPLAVRLLYAAMALATIAVGWLENRYYRYLASPRQLRLGRLVIVVFALSTLVNALSRSAPERWNALGAAVVVVGTVVMIRRPRALPG